MTNDNITLTGVVGTEPRHLVTSDGVPITSFRLASTQRRYDRATEKWVDGETNWFTVTSFRQLATNVAESVRKGERVIATGTLHIRDWDTDQKSGTSVEVEADVVAHDLKWGTAKFTRTPQVSDSAADEV